MASTLVSIIDGRPAEGSPAGTVSSPNPSRLTDLVAEVELADASTFAAACAAAKRAQQLWAGIPAPVRGRVVAAIGRIVEANKESLARLVTRELGKPYREALGEVQEIIDTCDFFLGEGRRLYGQTVPSEMPDKQLFTFRVPVGAVALVTAGNFPVAVPSWYLVPALVAGNTVVSKPAEFAAASAAATVGDPAQDVLYGPMLDQKFAIRFEEYLGWIQPHHKVLGSRGLGRISAANQRDGFVGDPEAG